LPDSVDVISPYNGSRHALKAKNFTKKKGFRIRLLSDEEASRNKTNSSVRAKVEQPFQTLKRIFGFNKVATGAWTKMRIDSL